MSHTAEASEIRTVPCLLRAFVCNKNKKCSVEAHRRWIAGGFSRSVRCLLKKEPRGSADNQRGLSLGLFLARGGGGTDLAPKAGLVNPRMPSREGLEGP